MAKKADVTATEHLRSLVTYLFQKKFEHLKQDTLDDVIFLFSLLPKILYPESKIATDMKNGKNAAREKVAKENVQIKKEIDKILNSIPSMSPSQLRRVIKLLMSDKPLLGIIASIKYRKIES